MEPAIDKSPRAKVLVADDDPVTRRLAALLLERMGYAVDTVGDGTSAVTVVVRERYDVVLLDCEMPVVDGYAAAAEIRRLEAAGRRTPIVAVTASVQQADVERALAAGMDAHVGKPIDRDALARTLAGLLRHEEPVPDHRADHGTAGAVIDPDTVDELRRIDRDGSIHQLLAMFLRDTDTQLARMDAALAAGDCAEISAAAHKLTGSAGFFGALRVAHLAHEIDVAARMQDPPSAAAVAELRAAVDEATRALAEELHPPS
ncbi:MAG TPA: response regulator [Acidimicrobiales bacterium]|nr:response regulator [Acidimicrobiales bacterium]